MVQFNSVYFILYFIFILDTASFALWVFPSVFDHLLIWKHIFGVNLPSVPPCLPLVHRFRCTSSSTPVQQDQVLKGFSQWPHADPGLTAISPKLEPFTSSDCDCSPSSCGDVVSEMDMCSRNCHKHVLKTVYRSLLDKEKSDRFLGTCVRILML